MIAKVVSKPLSVAPSNTSGLPPAKTAPVAVTTPVNVGADILGVAIVGVLIVGDVKVLFVSVCVAARPTKLSLCKALLNSDKVPVSVFASKSKVLFVSVCVVPLNKVSNCDSVTRPSVPPSDNKSKSLATNVVLVRSLALSIFTLASTTPNSKALADELTFNT